MKDQSAIKILPQDRLMAKTILRLIPSWVTPNQVTVLRFILTVPVVWLVLYHYYNPAIWLFILAVLTDAVDGAMARTRNQITEWGELFDPVADKLLIGAVGLLLIFRYLHWLLILIILTLEFITIIAAFIYKTHGGLAPVKANIFGKTKMVLQSSGIGLLLIFAQNPTNHVLSLIISIIFIISIGFTVLSMYASGL